MAINSVRAAAATPSQLGSTNTNTKQSQMDKDAFLKLLSTQLKYQDPMNPMSNQDFLAQTAQFSSLEQMANIADGFKAQLITSQMDTGVEMIGKTVTWQPAADTVTGDVPPTQTGKVEKVVVIDGAVMLRINDKNVPVSSVTEVL